MPFIFLIIFMAKNIELIKKDYKEGSKSIGKIVYNNIRNIETIKQIKERYDISENSFIMKLFGYCYNNPNIIYYINKYMNNKFDYSKSNFYHYIASILFIMDMNNHNKYNNLFFIKFSDLKDSFKFNVKKLFKEYYKTIHNKSINDNETYILYKLLLNKIINITDIEFIDNNLHDKPTIKINELESFLNNTTDSNTDNVVKESDINEYINNLKSTPLSNEVQTFIDELKLEKQNRIECKNCKLFQNHMVVLDSNIDILKPVDISFIALNPSNDDVVYNKPLINEAGIYHRKKMYFLPKETNWVITNCILCNTNNQKEIGSKDKEVLEVANNCRYFLEKIVTKMPSKIYVPIGSITNKVFKIEGSVKVNSGKVFTINKSKIIPLIHPSAVLQYGGDNEKAFNNGWNTIYSELNVDASINESKVLNNNNKTQSSNKKNNLPKNVNYIDDNTNMSELTLFDINSLDYYNTLMIFIDEFGKKYYKVTNEKYPIYIKDTHNFKDNVMISSQFDNICYVNKYERNQIRSLLIENLDFLKAQL